MAKRNGSTQSRSRDRAQRNGEGSNRPWAELRSGMLKTTVWENESSGGNSFFTTQLVRIYQDQNDEWQETHGLGRDDLLRAANLLRRTFDAIESEEQERREASRG